MKDDKTPKQAKNIFEAVTRHLTPKKPETPKNKSNPKPTKLAPPHHDTMAAKDPELVAMMQKMREMKQDLQHKVDILVKRSGMKPDVLKKFMEDPKNFSKAEWEQIKNAKEVLGEQVWSSIGRPIDKKASTPTLSQPDPAAPPKPKDRKSKTLGARKKWIPMQ